MTLTREQLQKELTYLPETGEFWWNGPGKGRTTFRRDGEFAADKV